MIQVEYFHHYICRNSRATFVLKVDKMGFNMEEKGIQPLILYRWSILSLFEVGMSR